MKIKVDEDIPPVVANWLREQGYQSSTVYEQGMSGWKDGLLWEAVQAEEQFLITADKGFGDIRFYPPGSHAGVLLLPPDENGIEPIFNLLNAVLGEVDLSELVGALSVATPPSLRVRRAF